MMANGSSCLLCVENTWKNEVQEISEVTTGVCMQIRTVHSIPQFPSQFSYIFVAGFVHWEQYWTIFEECYEASHYLTDCRLECWSRSLNESRLNYWLNRLGHPLTNCLSVDYSMTDTRLAAFVSRTSQVSRHCLTWFEWSKRWRGVAVGNQYYIENSSAWSSNCLLTTS